MDDDVFVKTLKEAMEGNPEAIQTIIDEYGNLINKYSCRNGEIVKYEIHMLIYIVELEQVVLECMHNQLPQSELQELW